MLRIDPNYLVIVVLNSDCSDIAFLGECYQLSLSSMSRQAYGIIHRHDPHLELDIHCAVSMLAPPSIFT